MPPYIISIQGCHGVGKSTLLSNISRICPKFLYAFESVAHLETIKRRQKLDLNNLNDFLVNQKRFISWELTRYTKFKNEEVVILDRGAESTEFFTLHYPRIMDKNWEIEHLLKEELSRLQTCRANQILYLTASSEQILLRSERDQRVRPTLDRWMQFFEKPAQAWFEKFDNCKLLETTTMTANEVCNWTIIWLRSLLNNLGLTNI